MADSFEYLPRAAEPAEPKRRKVLVTGAAGRIGSYFAEHSGERYELTLTDLPEADLDAVAAYGQVRPAELGDLETLKQLCAGQDTVVHLAAHAAPDTPWGPLLETNIAGTYNAFVAALSAGCRRVVFASSVHAVSGYVPGRQVQADDPVNPGDLYGVSKCFGEALGRFMAGQHGLSTICVRIGAFQPVEAAEADDALRIMHLFVSHRDLCQLLQRCVDDQTLRFAIVHGLSDNRFNRMDITETAELVGYQPADDFTAENDRLAGLDLDATVEPHNETHGEASGLRDELNPPDRRGAP